MRLAALPRTSALPKLAESVHTCFELQKYSTKWMKALRRTTPKAHHHDGHFARQIAGLRAEL